VELLEINDLTTNFHINAGIVQAVNKVSFKLKKGETLGIVGESGSGKSTLALSVSRLLPDGGETEGGNVYLNGVDLLSLSDEEVRLKRWTEFSLIFQGAMNALNPVMKVGTQISEVIQLHDGCSARDARKRVAELFEMVEIDSSRIDNYPHEFSGGMKQRVMIAMAIACSPSLLIGDEPTTGLDVIVQAQILDLMRRLCDSREMGMIIITHDLSILSEIADRVAVMYAGNLVEIGRTDDILLNYRHPYTGKLAESFPDINGKREMVSSIPGIPPNLLNPPSGCKFHPRCEKACEKCRNSIPDYVDLGNEHIVACHFEDGKML
jgi:peptide/nickel transport system ATP-binding protein